MSQLELPPGFEFLPFDNARGGVCRGCGNSLKRCPKGAVRHLDCGAIFCVTAPLRGKQGSMICSKLRDQQLCHCAMVKAGRAEDCMCQACNKRRKRRAKGADKASARPGRPQPAAAGERAPHGTAHAQPTPSRVRPRRTTATRVVYALAEEDGGDDGDDDCAPETRKRRRAGAPAAAASLGWAAPRRGSVRVLVRWKTQTGGVPVAVLLRPSDPWSVVLNSIKDALMLGAMPICVYDGETSAVIASSDLLRDNMKLVVSSAAEAHRRPAAAGGGKGFCALPDPGARPLFGGRRRSDEEVQAAEALLLHSNPPRRLRLTSQLSGASAGSFLSLGSMDASGTNDLEAQSRFAASTPVASSSPDASKRLPAGSQEPRLSLFNPDHRPDAAATDAHHQLLPTLPSLKRDMSGTTASAIAELATMEAFDGLLDAEAKSSSGFPAGGQSLDPEMSADLPDDADGGDAPRALSRAAGIGGDGLMHSALQHVTLARQASYGYLHTQP